MTSSVDLPNNIPAPTGYASWLDYAIATMDVRSLENDHDDGLQPQWPAKVTREDMRAAAAAELATLRAHNPFPRTPPY